MRAGHAAQVDPQAALELQKERPAAASQGAAFALATGAAQPGPASAGANTVAAIAARAGNTQTAATAQSAPAAGAGPALPGDRATASSTGSLLLALRQLSASDPARFQQATAAIASQLQAVASAASDSNAQALAPLIDSFRAAAQSGDPPSLQSLQAGTSAAGTHPSVVKYAREGSANAAAFSLEALREAVQSSLS